MAAISITIILAFAATVYLIVSGGADDEKAERWFEAQDDQDDTK